MLACEGEWSWYGPGSTQQQQEAVVEEERHPLHTGGLRSWSLDGGKLRACTTCTT